MSTASKTFFQKKKERLKMFYLQYLLINDEELKEKEFFDKIKIIIMKTSYKQ